MFNVSPQKEDNLKEKMRRYGVKESDINEHFIRSSGRGGQHVNKTSTCVYLKHIPTKIEVKCSRERSQSLNRFLARRMLLDKIEKKIFGEVQEEKARISKIRKQKKKRSKRAKEKILEDKRIHSEKKTLRKAPGREE